MRERILVITNRRITSMRFQLCLVVTVCTCFSKACYSVGFDVAALTQVEGEAQREVVWDAIERHRRKLSNIEFTSSTTTRGFKWQDGARGAPTNSGIQSDCAIKRLGGSYKQSTKLFEDVATPELKISSESNFISEIGESRVFGKFEGSDKLFGRVDIKRDNSEALNPAAYYLADGLDTNQSMFWPPILEQLSDWSIKVDTNNSHVIISLPLTDSRITSGKLSATREITLDWERDAALVGDKLKWMLKRGDREDWRIIDSRLDKLEKFEGVSVPTRITTLKRTSAFGEDQCVAEVTEVSNVSLGSVKSKDLHIDFPPGTYVTNIVQHTSYTVGRDGEPDGVPEPLYEVDELRPGRADGDSRPRSESFR